MPSKRPLNAYQKLVQQIAKSNKGMKFGDVLRKASAQWKAKK